MSEPLTAEALAPARAGGYRRLTFDNGAYEQYQAVFVQHSAGEWDRILVARDDGRIAALLANLINDAARAPGLDVERLMRAWDACGYSPKVADVEWLAFAREYALDAGTWDAALSTVPYDPIDHADREGTERP